MNESKISVRYARALYDLVKEDNAMDAHRQDMELLSLCIRDIPELQYIIHSPVIRVSEKTKIFAEIFKTNFNDSVPDPMPGILNMRFRITS